MDKLRVLFEIGLRNLFARVMNVVIGGIILVGTLMVVAGGSLVSSVDESVSKSLRGSVTGDLQIYNGKSKEDVAVFGSNTGGDVDLTPMLSFPKVEAAVRSVPNVKDVVPMGIASALVNSGNTVDLTLEELRGLVKREEEEGRTPELDAQRESMKSHVQQIVSVIQDDRKNLDALIKRTAEDREADKDLVHAGSNDFWKNFEKDPDASLEFLENRVAPQVADADMLPLRYVGTDTVKFQRAFDRMTIVDGTSIPVGHRGFLFNKYTYEEMLKLRSARRLDKIKDALANGSTLAQDATLQRYVKENRNQPREIQLQLDPLKTKTAVARLQKDLGSTETNLAALLNAFFDTNDQNFSTRYDAFYRDLAPLLQLYRLRVGDVLTIKAFTKSGYQQSVNVKIYGTFLFKGLEKSSLAGAFNIMDLMSFRSLYGYLTSEKMQEISAIQKEAGAKSVDRAHAEDELFGEGASTSPTVTRSQSASTSELKDDASASALAGTGKAARRKRASTETFTQEQLDDGIVLNAAVTLHDPTKLDVTLKAIDAATSAQKLEIKTATWLQASGRLGQFVYLIKLVLFVAVLIIFIVLMVVMNNAVVMATLQRIREIGTVRAIGGGRGFVVMMILVESIVLGLVFGGVGALLGMGLITVLHAVGIRATSDQLFFFFGGPRLFPAVGWGSVFTGFFIVLFVTTLSTLYPAWLAMRVSPLRAMQSDD